MNTNTPQPDFFDVIAPGSLPIVDYVDCEILMHRDCHFGGQFSIMLDYYSEDHRKGIQPEFSIKRINELREIEQALEKNLSDVLLNEDQKELVSKALTSYQFLKTLYETSSQNHFGKAIAELLLSEEEEPEQEIQAVVNFKDTVVDTLLSFVEKEDFYNSLFPGYGLAPEIAVRCLGLIGNSKAVPTLFSKVGQVDFFVEDAILEALKKIGPYSKEFLLKNLQKIPFTEDNQKAAVALVHFREDQEVAHTAFYLLQSGHFSNKPSFLSYLVLICEGLKESPLASAFIELQNSPQLSKLLKQDIKDITQSWKH